MQPEQMSQLVAQNQVWASVRLGHNVFGPVANFDPIRWVGSGPGWSRTWQPAQLHAGSN